MKKILLIGELNKSLANLNDSLLENFQVQVCSVSEENVRNMLKIVNPDLIIICLVGVYDIECAIFKLIKELKTSTPVITISKKQEYLLYEEYYHTEQFTALFRPITKTQLILACQEKLGDSKNEEIAGKIAEPESDKNVKKRIMVVDDSALVLRNIKNMLEPKYHVMVAGSGKQLLDFLDKKRPDLILLDYDMPGMDGKQTFEKLKEDENGKDIPVIFLTGVADREHIYAVAA